MELYRRLWLSFVPKERMTRSGYNAAISATRSGRVKVVQTVYPHIRIRQCSECSLKQPARGFGKNMASDMAVAHMHDAYRIGSYAQAEHAQFLPKGLQDADAVYQLVPTQLPKGCGQSDERNGQRVRTLSVDSKRVAIKCRFLKPGTTRKHILGIVPLHRQEEQRQYRAANGKP